MKAVLIRQHGGVEQVYVGEAEEPKVRPGQVLVRAKAAALNHLDLFVLGGIPGIQLEMPHIPGADGSGVVEETGEGVSTLKPGDRVMLNACLWCGECEFCKLGEESLCVRLGLVGEHVPGTFAEYFVVPEKNLELVPEDVTFEQAAAFALVFQTAWRMLMTQAQLKASEDVYIHGVGGGVATAALQLVNMFGGRAFVSSSSDEKLEKAKELGADFCFNYTKNNVVREVLKATSGRGVDVVVDTVGAATWMQSLKMVRKGGRIVTCGATTGPNPETEIRLIFWKQLQILGSTMSNCEEYRQLVQMLGAGKLRPVISRVFSLSEGPGAFRYLAEEGQFGKVVLSIP
jgi:NADPH2:quinone reductase